MKVQVLLQKLPFVGQAEGERLTYYVFEGNRAYLVVSPNSRGGLNMNVVDMETPEVISHRFSGQRVTGRMVAEKGRRPDLFGDNFSPLNALYTMVALGRARKLKQRVGRAMVFKIK
ncbi:MAG TPA: hypothetical protein VKI40_05455 [Terriglobales bacterium]|jgi:hypothetical protein|nr:hypothetical protein [Terriglobales bacterium]